MKVALGRRSENRNLAFRRFEETFELPDTGRMPHFAQGFCLDLANTLSSDLELPTHFLECSAISIDQTKPLFQHLPLALCQSLEHVFDFLLQQNNGGHVARVFRAFVLDKVTKISFFAFANGGLEPDRLLRRLEDRADT